jgi:predicted SAM-dependent methyltransferase
MSDTEPLRLHIGGSVRRDGWKVLNIQSGAHVDFIGNCLDLSMFRDASVSEIYASHVLEHVDYVRESHRALKEFWRVLVPKGRLMVGVPDLDTLCAMMNAPYFDSKVRFLVMRMIYGGQTDAHDYHRGGYNFELLSAYLAMNGFDRVRRVASFGLFDDTTEKTVNGIPISLNIEAFKGVRSADVPPLS